MQGVNGVTNLHLLLFSLELLITMILAKRIFTSKKNDTSKKNILIISLELLITMILAVVMMIIIR